MATFDLSAKNLDAFSNDHWLSNEKNVIVLRLTEKAFVEEVGLKQLAFGRFRCFAPCYGSLTDADALACKINASAYIVGVQWTCGLALNVCVSDLALLLLVLRFWSFRKHAKRDMIFLSHTALFSLRRKVAYQL